MFIRRSGSADDPWLNEKLWIFVIGAIVAMMGMILDNLWVMVAAGLILIGGVALRFVPRGDAGQSDDPGTDDPSDPFSAAGPDEHR